MHLHHDLFRSSKLHRRQFVVVSGFLWRARFVEPTRIGRTLPLFTKENRWRGELSKCTLHNPSGCMSGRRCVHTRAHIYRARSTFDLDGNVTGSVLLSFSLPHSIRRKDTKKSAWLCSNYKCVYVIFYATAPCALQKKKNKEIVTAVVLSRSSIYRRFRFDTVLLRICISVVSR